MKQMTISVMNNCRSGQHAPYIREWGIYITRHFEKFPPVFGSLHLKSIQVGVLCLFIKSVRDLMQILDPIIGEV
jgi:hypothetical protein